MSRFGKEAADQLYYKNCKLEKANEELVNRINNELIPTIKNISISHSLIETALDKACEDAADNCCPHEFELYDCDKCAECPHDRELHNDAQRDIACWKQYYLNQAQK